MTSYHVTDVRIARAASSMYVIARALLYEDRALDLEFVTLYSHLDREFSFVHEVGKISPCHHLHLPVRHLQTYGPEKRTLPQPPATITLFVKLCSVFFWAARLCTRTFSFVSPYVYNLSTGE